MSVICPECNYTSISNAKFCNQCGTPMTILLTCNFCGNKLWAYEKFCDTCGQSRVEALNTLPVPSLSLWQKFQKCLREIFF